MRIVLIQTPGLVPRLRAFGCLLVEDSEPLSCVSLPWRRFPLRVMQGIQLLQRLPVQRALHV
jgi:hypothetical protein